ncbi:MAG: hypothetical protein KAS32_30115 [Candidatus Peribacteraceae bacterium]|nr:hypothetical protein [Candidatus Peribacteraceae bacterium]
MSKDKDVSSVVLYVAGAIAILVLVIFMLAFNERNSEIKLIDYKYLQYIKVIDPSFGHIIAYALDDGKVTKVENFQIVEKFHEGHPESVVEGIKSKLKVANPN